MKRLIDYDIRQANFDDFDSTPQYYNLPLLIEVEGKKQILPCGTSDQIEVFKVNDDIWVLSDNFNLDYASLTILDFDEFDGGYNTECYIDNISETYQDFFDCSSEQKIDYLSEFLY